MSRELRNAGHICTSRWLGGERTYLSAKDVHDAAFQAKMDLDDIDSSDAIICKIFPRGTPISGGGRHIEFGYAMAKGKRLMCVGEGAETVFHLMHNVTVYDTIKDAVRNL